MAHRLAPPLHRVTEHTPGPALTIRVALPTGGWEERVWNGEAFVLPVVVVTRAA